VVGTIKGGYEIAEVGVELVGALLAEPEVDQEEIDDAAWEEMGMGLPIPVVL
jgi:hypothetical protein